jgi:ribosomal protein S12 methylthiotransferase accessory factor
VATNAAPHVVGLTVHPAPGGAAVVATPRGDVLEIGWPAAEVAALVAACDGATAAPDVVARWADQDAAGEVLAALVDHGCLSYRPPVVGAAHWSRWEAPPATPDRPAGARVLAGGDGELVAALAGVMARSGLPGPETGAGAHAGDADLLVTATSSFEVDVLGAAAAAAATAGVPWVGFHLERGTGWLGPLVIPGRTAEFADFLDRRRSTAADPGVWSALVAPPAWGSPYLPPPAELEWMLCALVIEVHRWLAGGPCRLLSAAVEADPVGLRLVVHPVLPLPGSVPPPLVAGWRPSPATLVDEQTGVVVGLRDTVHHPSVPAALRTVAADVADMSQASRRPWRNDVLCGGTSFDSRDGAVAAAVGEAAERYCANWTGTLPLTLASYRELRGRGQRALDPRRLVLYSDRQYAEAGFPFVPFGPDLRVHWVHGRSLTTGDEVWLPASQVYINWRSDAPGGEPHLHFHNYAGVQAGPSLEFALASALEEVIERDAAMTWWANRHPLPALALPVGLRGLWDGVPAAAGQRASAIALDNEFGVPVVAGVVEHVPDGLLTVGFAARADPVEAVRKAWGEALVLQEGSRDLDRPDGQCAIRSLLGRHSHGGDYLKPWRADRSYLDAYRPDFRDVIQLLCQQQVNLDPRARAVVSPWLDVPESRSLRDVPSLAARDLPTYQRLVEGRGYEILYADLTTPDVAACGLRVVRAIVPGLVPNFPAAFPAWGLGRVRTHAESLGWPTTAEEDLNTFPLPYA